MFSYENNHPKKIRSEIREGRWGKTTAGLCPDYIQANLVILPKDLAFDFMIFCYKNPKPCPIIDITEIGSPVPKLAAPDADLRFDVPKYRIFKNGELIEEVDNIERYWQDDFVSFLIGCSLTFEQVLVKNDIPIRHIEDKKALSAYITNIECNSSFYFHGPMVVTMRPILYSKVVRSVQITTNYPLVHGAPVHIGNPKLIGIKDINKPDFGESTRIENGEVPVFWACGVTPQVVAMESKPRIMITHAPGYMFLTDLKNCFFSIM